MSKDKSYMMSFLTSNMSKKSISYRISEISRPIRNLVNTSITYHSNVIHVEI